MAEDSKARIDVANKNPKMQQALNSMAITSFKAANNQAAPGLYHSGQILANSWERGK